MNSIFPNQEQLTIIEKREDTNMTTNTAIIEPKLPETLLDKINVPVKGLPSDLPPEEDDEDEKQLVEEVWTREEAVETLISDNLMAIADEALGGGNDFLDDLFRYGFAGYANMSIAELENEVNDMYGSDTHTYVIRDQEVIPPMDFLEQIRKRTEKKDSILNVFQDVKPEPEILKPNSD